MSAALYLVLERAEPGLETYVDGKALSRAEAELSALARSLEVTPLMDFFSINPGELLANVDGLGADLPEDAAPPEEWFAAAAGLVTVRKLLEHVDADLDSVPSGTEVANELTGFVHLLEEAERRGIRWHLAVDY
jgi:hypothetical protein